MKEDGLQLFKFLSGLNPELNLPTNLTTIQPFHQKEVSASLKKFCTKFYSSKRKRILILGINPGRFGSGTTGIAFTDPIVLENECGIKNNFDKRSELSSRFIYEMINAFGGPDLFYDNFMLSSVCPVGFLKGTKNYNYYDDKALLNTTKDLIADSLITHASWNVHIDLVISLGKKNASYLEAFNRDLKLFGKILTLDHPRYIMQYQLKNKQHYIDSYLEMLYDAMNI